MDDVIAFSSVSVDGYAAGANDDLSRLHRWMYDFDRRSPTGFDDPFLRSFRSASVVIFGRRTYDLGQEPWGDEQVFESPVVVVSHEARPPLRKNGTTFTFAEGPATELLAHARRVGQSGNKPEGPVVLMGSPTITQQFLAAGLVTSLLLHQVPVLLGGGVRLFDTLPSSIELQPELMTAGQEVSLLQFKVAGDR